MNNILFLGSIAPPHGGIAEHLKWEIGKHHQPMLVFDYAKETGAMKFYLPRLPWRKLRYLPALFRIHKLVVDNKINVLAAYHTYPEGYLAYLYKKSFPHIRVAVTIFGELHTNPKRWYRKILAGVNAILATSHYCAKGLENIGIPPRWAEIIHHGVDLEKFHPARNKFEPPMILYVGYLHPRAGLECLIDATQGLNLRVALAGEDYGIRKDLEKRIRESGQNANYYFTGPLCHDEVILFFKYASIYVCPMNTKAPCMGASIKHAMACGLPVVASNVGGIPEAVVHGVTGFIFEVDDAGELRNMLCTLLYQPGLPEKMGKAARKRAEELFDAAKTSREILDTLNKL